MSIALVRETTVLQALAPAPLRLRLRLRLRLGSGSGPAPALAPAVLLFHLLPPLHRYPRSILADLPLCPRGCRSQLCLGVLLRLPPMLTPAGRVALAVHTPLHSAAAVAQS